MKDFEEGTKLTFPLVLTSVSDWWCFEDFHVQCDFTTETKINVEKKQILMHLWLIDLILSKHINLVLFAHAFVFIWYDAYLMGEFRTSKTKEKEMHWQLYNVMHTPFFNWWFVILPAVYWMMKLRHLSIT